MSIGPISNSMISSYYVAGATSFSGAKDYEYELIKQQLMAMGITVTGDKNTDKMRLEMAKRMQETMASQSSISSRDSIPFDDIMNTLDLEITGNLEKDYETTIDKLEDEIRMASTDEEKAYFEALKDEVETDYIDSKQFSQGTFSGASQLASLNRFMLGI